MSHESEDFKTPDKRPRGRVAAAVSVPAVVFDSGGSSSSSSSGATPPSKFMRGLQWDVVRRKSEDAHSKRVREAYDCDQSASWLTWHETVMDGNCSLDALLSATCLAVQAVQWHPEFVPRNAHLRTPEEKASQDFALRLLRCMLVRRMLAVTDRRTRITALMDAYTFADGRSAEELSDEQLQSAWYAHCKTQLPSNFRPAKLRTLDELGMQPIDRQTVRYLSSTELTLLAGVVGVRLLLAQVIDHKLYTRGHVIGRSEDRATAMIPGQDDTIPAVELTQEVYKTAVTHARDTNQVLVLLIQVQGDGYVHYVWAHADLAVRNQRRA